MTVAPGTRLGPYEITSRIGAGGMGEVFRAKDTRLDRSVAVKILPAEFAGNAQLRARFEREARAISQLNHPNICTLFDVGDDYLVMELLEGETLADRLSRGALPIRDVLRVGIQIADALDRAHRSGIIHRDLKPGNVMLTKSGAKLLDFGLAKGGAAAVNLDGATEQRPLTQEGTILGTFQYMSPEQLEGADVDARSDIFAFGAMLYEMATGHRAFDGKTKTSLIAAIVAGDPKPIAELQPLTPPALEKLIRACIEKEPEERIQTAHDVALQLRWINDTISSTASTAAVAIPRRRQWMRAGVAAAMVIAVIATWFAATRWQRAHTPRRVYRATMEASEGSPLGFGSGPMALSPDGTMLVYAGLAKTGGTMLFIRRLDETAWRGIEGTAGAYSPFWSPDGTQVAFFFRGNLLKVAANGSAATETIARVGDDVASGSWTGSTIVYARFASGIYRIHASGGEPVNVVRLDKQCPQLTSPYLMPDERHLVYFCSAPPPAESANFVTTLDGSEKPHVFLKANAGVAVAADQLLFSRGSMLYSQSFNARAMTLTGEPRPIANVQVYNDARPAYFAATDRELVFLPGGSEVKTELARVDRTGKRLGMIAPPGFYFAPRLSPDGKRVATDMSDTKGNGDIWIWDTAGTGGTRFSFDPENESIPVWSPDGAQVAYMYGMQAPYVVKKQLNGGGAAQPVVKELRWQVTADWSSDGKTLLVVGSPRDSGDADIFAYSIPERRLTPLAATAGVYETSPRFSPDGHWFTYVFASENGRFEVYVQPFPPNGSKWQVSSGGGYWPVFSRDGKSLFYVNAEGKMMQSAISTTGGFAAQTPQPLFTVRLRENSDDVAQYDVAPDGTFVLNSVPDNAGSPMTLVVNWRDALGR